MRADDSLGSACLPITVLIPFITPVWSWLAAGKTSRSPQARKRVQLVRSWLAAGQTSWLLETHPGCWQVRSLRADQNVFVGQHLVDNVARCWSSVLHHLWQHGSVGYSSVPKCLQVAPAHLQPTYSTPFITGSPLLHALRVLVSTLCLCRGNERKPRRVTALSGVTIAQVAIGGWHCLALDAGGAHVGAQALPSHLLLCCCSDHSV